MRTTTVLRIIASLAAVLATTACRGVDAGADGNSSGALRLASAQQVASSQRLGPDGYPQLGAYPRAAAPQMSDAQVANNDAELNAAAARDASRAGSSGYASRIAALEAARRGQDAAIAARRASQPVASQTPGGGPRPEDVLLEIEQGS